MRFFRATEKQGASKLSHCSPHRALEGQPLQGQEQALHLQLSPAVTLYWGILLARGKYLLLFALRPMC
jgi:hypothetical protein